MAGVITHILIGMKLLENINDRVIDCDGFYLGTIAPDSIMSKTDYTRFDKKRTHLREGISSEDWYKDEYKELYDKRIQDFVKMNLNDVNNDTLSFNLGYLIHLLTDQIFHYTIRIDVVNTLKKKSLSYTGKDLFEVMTNELDAMDFYLLKKYPEIADILKRISIKCTNYELKEFISSKYLCANFKWINNRFFNSEKETTNFLYLTPEEVRNYIENTRESLQNIVVNFERRE